MHPAAASISEGTDSSAPVQSDVTGAHISSAFSHKTPGCMDGADKPTLPDVAFGDHRGKPDGHSADDPSALHTSAFSHSTGQPDTHMTDGHPSARDRAGPSCSRGRKCGHAGDGHVSSSFWTTSVDLPDAGQRLRPVMLAQQQAAGQSSAWMPPQSRLPSHPQAGTFCGMSFVTSS